MNTINTILLLSLCAGSTMTGVVLEGKDSRFWMWQEGINAPCDDVVVIGVGPDRMVNYLGRVEHEDSLVPANVQDFNETAVYTLQGKLYTSTKYEVLCGSVAWQRVRFPSRLPFSSVQVGQLAGQQPLFACRAARHDYNSTMTIGVIDSDTLACNITYGQKGYYDSIYQNFDYEVLVTPVD